MKKFLGLGEHSRRKLEGTISTLHEGLGEAEYNLSRFFEQKVKMETEYDHLLKVYLDVLHMYADRTMECGGCLIPYPEHYLKDVCGCGHIGLCRVCRKDVRLAEKYTRVCKGCNKRMCKRCYITEKGGLEEGDKLPKRHPECKGGSDESLSSSEQS
jgi:hypothetical protein